MCADKAHHSSHTCVCVCVPMLSLSYILPLCHASKRYEMKTDKKKIWKEQEKKTQIGTPLMFPIPLVDVQKLVPRYLTS